MRIQACASILVALLLAAPMARAAAPESHVVDRTEMQAAVTARTVSQTAQRTEIETLLGRPEVRRLADRSGLDLERARAAAATLQGEELDRLAAQATIANAQLEGGLVIYATTLIVILLIVIILLLI
jgi:hypothetical protein